MTGAARMAGTAVGLAKPRTTSALARYDGPAQTHAEVRWGWAGRSNAGQHAPDAGMLRNGGMERVEEPPEEAEEDGGGGVGTWGTCACEHTCERGTRGCSRTPCEEDAAPAGRKTA